MTTAAQLMWRTSDGDGAREKASHKRPYSENALWSKFLALKMLTATNDRARVHPASPHIIVAVLRWNG
jgi:hypothetical protein